jgi:putative SOS response-associated peptidase YedK
VQGGERISETMHWGLIPAWSKDGKMKFPTFNARAETVDTLNTFRDTWRKGRRCLVVTDGFYEWRKSDKQPFAIGMADNDLMVMAGLWDEWKSPVGETIRSCTVITCAANEVIGELHDRMPVILAEKDWPKWLGEEPATSDELKALLVPAPSQTVKVWKVDKRVGNVNNNSRDLADPIPELL